MRLVVFLFISLAGAAASIAQNITYVNAAWLDAMKANKSDTVYVVNFWATWCKPCVEELPAFEKLHQTYSAQKVKVLMVSCDFRKQVTKRLIPFVKNKKMRAQVMFMNETNPDIWISKVNADWQGAIPATWIICGTRNYIDFEEGETTFSRLEQKIKPLITQSP